MADMSFADAHLGFTLLRLLNQHQIGLIYDALDDDAPLTFNDADIAAIAIFLEEVEDACGDEEEITWEVRVALARLLAQRDRLIA
jgi:hypothetical protein